MFSNTGVERIMNDEYLRILVTDFFRADDFRSFIEGDKTLNRKVESYIEFRDEFIEDFLEN